MNRRLRTFVICSVVLSLVMIVGGIIYTVFTAQKDARYSQVQAEITDIITQPLSDNAEQVTVMAVRVSFTDSTSVIRQATLYDFPVKIQVGGIIDIRYLTDDPTIVTAKKTDWFTPILLLCLGVTYAIGLVLVAVFRVKAGYYAFADGLDTNQANTTS